jgi:acetylglutamate synthase
MMPRSRKKFNKTYREAKEVFTQVFFSSTDKSSMKLAGLFILSLICLSCGGLMKTQEVVRAPASVEALPSAEVTDQKLYLAALEIKYSNEKKAINLAIVRSMITELEARYPSLPASYDDLALENLRKRPGFLALELTIEHLSHRESVKLSTRHSAYLSNP